MRGVRTIKSRASTKSRYRLGQMPAVVGVPPVMVDAPEIYGGFWASEYYGSEVLGYATAPNYTLVAFAGSWDDADGETTVVGQFYNSSTAEFLGNPGDTELFVTEELEGAYVNYGVSATRGGVTTYRLSSLTIFVSSVTETQAQWDWRLGVQQYMFWFPGQPIPRATHYWFVQPEFGSYTRHGEWYKNGVATGETGETYSDTEEGDIVVWYEWITNAFDLSSYAPEFLKSVATGWSDGAIYKSYVNRIGAAAERGSYESITDRADGVVGGATSMEVFSTRDPVAGNYVVNENNWLRDLYPQLCAVSAGFHGRLDQPTGVGWQQANGWTNSYGPTLITPRHIISSGHTQFHNCDGTKRNYTVRWVLEDGKTVEAKVIGGHKYQDGNPGHPCYLNPGYSNSISLLDRDVQALGVPVMPMLNLESALDMMEARYLPTGLVSQCQSAADRYGPHQEEAYKAYSMSWTQGRTVFEVGSDYPVLHNPMFYSANPTIAGLKYYYFGGDSGTPYMAIVNDTVFLRQILSGGNCYTDADNNQLDAMILEADTLAVQRGDIPELTGYTVTRCYDHANPNLLLVSPDDPTAILISEADPTPLLALPN